jgi:hypothetical protein
MRPSKDHQRFYRFSKLFIVVIIIANIGKHDQCSVIGADSMKGGQSNRPRGFVKRDKVPTK